MTFALEISNLKLFSTPLSWQTTLMQVIKFGHSLKYLSNYKIYQNIQLYIFSKSELLLEGHTEVQLFSVISAYNRSLPVQPQNIIMLLWFVSRCPGEALCSHGGQASWRPLNQLCNWFIVQCQDWGCECYPCPRARSLHII